MGSLGLVFVPPYSVAVGLAIRFAICFSVRFAIVMRLSILDLYTITSELNCK